jgi:phage shock protein A
MDINKLKTIFDRILSKQESISRFERLKTHIDERTQPNDLVTITVEKETFDVDPKELKKILDKKITENDTTTDLADLKREING